MVAKNRKKKKSSVKSIIGYSVIALVFLFVISFLLITNWKMYKKRDGLAERVQELKAQVDTLKKKNESLKEESSAIGTEEHLEKVAREQLDMKKPGEEVVVVQEEEGEQKPEQEQKKSWWERIKSLWQR